MKIIFSVSLEITRDSDPGDSDSQILTDASWRRLRKDIGKRDNFICQYCGETSRHGHVDHMVPLSKGGTDEPDNLVWACAECNLSKGARTIEEWREADRQRFLERKPDALIDDDNIILDRGLQTFVTDISSGRGTDIRTWVSDIGRNLYALYRDALIGHGIAEWNSYKSDGKPNKKQGWSLIAGAHESQLVLQLDCDRPRDNGPANSESMVGG